MAFFRGYHSVALLMPDGRVFVGGGRDSGRTNSPFERADYEILSPSYITDLQPRPVITFVGSKVLNRQGDPSQPPNPVLSTFVTVDMGQPSPPLEAVMISLGSMTHSYNTSQRSVQVAITNAIPSPSNPNVYTMQIWAPDYDWAPPG